MVRRIAGDLEHLQARVSDVLDGAKEISWGTADLLANILKHVEKDLWMLRAWLHRDEALPPAAILDEETAPRGANAGVTDIPALTKPHRLSYMQPD